MNDGVQWNQIELLHLFSRTILGYFTKKNNNEWSWKDVKIVNKRKAVHNLVRTK